MSKLQPSDFKIGQQIGVLWRSETENGTLFKFRKAKISRLSTTVKGTIIYTNPKLFSINFKVEDGEFEDYRTIPEGGLLMVNTPMFISNETADYFEELSERWNKTPPKSIWEG